MKNLIIGLFVTANTLPWVLAETADPIADFKVNLTVPSGDKILKWECDLNGDGKAEILLSLKSDHAQAEKEHKPSGWVIYISNPPGTSYSESAGIELEPKTIDGVLPDIDPESCFIGQITELGKRGIVTMQIDNPCEGESIGKIYAYTIEGDHLKRTELAQYVVTQGPHALFTKYLADDKRTHITIQEIDP